MFDVFIVEVPGFDWNLYNIQERFPHAKVIKFKEDFLDLVTQCVYQSRTEMVWVIRSDNLYDGFDFEYSPVPWEASQIHCWGTESNKFDLTLLVPCRSFKEQRPSLTDLTSYRDINWKDTQITRLRGGSASVHQVAILNMGDNPTSLSVLTTRFPDATVTRYYNNHLDSIRRCVSKATGKYLWVISTCCDYSDFDFGFVPSPWEKDQIHCWASGSQKFGDTFLVPVDEMKAQWGIERLEWFREINWHEDGVPRYPYPVIESGDENIPATVVDLDFGVAPYAWVNGTAVYDPSLWRDRAIHVFNRAGSVVLVPTEVRGQIRSEIYDFPHIFRHETSINSPKPLDIVYISNGEPDAEKWYQHLCKCAGREVKRVMNVPGRMAAYKAAAQCSDTPWFFAVFAKLEVDAGFDWNWQPDYLQEPKHYIFHAQNPVNGLVYGHQAMIAYNKRLTLETDVSGLDFTLSKPHCVVPIRSGVAHYNADEWTTWRTAFREVIKLKHDSSSESALRLRVWTTKAEGPFSEWSLRGAQDALDFYDEANGDYDLLMLSYDWAWLHDRFTAHATSL
jgi:hypothetical protein